MGEPSDDPQFKLPDVINDSITKIIESEAYNGYTDPCGAPEARQAIVDKFCKPGHPFTKDEVFFTFGCSGALFTAVASMCEEGTNLLVPAPGFALI